MNKNKQYTFRLLLLMTLSAAAIVPVLSAQESILISYERNFMRAGLAAKAEILKDAATDDSASEFIGQLYDFSLNFALRNAEILSDDQDMIALTALASQGVGSVGYTDSVDTLWEIFQVYRNTLTRTEVLKALSLLGKGKARVVNNLNEFLSDQNNRFRSRMAVDNSTLAACISALAVLGDDSSFPVLFSIMVSAYPENITKEASKALSEIQGDYKTFLTELIQRNPPVEKLAALRAGLSNSRFSPADQGELAGKALEVSLASNIRNDEGSLLISALGYEAVLALTRMKWTKASPLVVKNFYKTQTDYLAGGAPKERLLEAIACLGAMDSSEAVQALALQLGYINSQTERNGEYDADVTIAVVSALGEIGDKAAFDYLLYVSYLPYPESIQAAAREALNRLQW
jgi:hypothetical protein